MSAHSQQNHTPALVVLTTLFFMMGFITCMNDILIPHLKDIFELTYVQAMLIQFCFFTAYAIMSIPMGYFVGKIGYKNGVIGGFVLTAIGCLLFYPAAGSHSYPTFLGALFILASGVLCTAIVGGAIVPVVQGWAADTYGLMISFVVSAICYVYIVFFALKGYKADE